MSFQIAIDGPSGAGKSTVADIIAERLNILHLDTGAMYRAAGLFMFRRGVSLSDTQTVESLLPLCDLRVEFNGAQRTLLGNEDVSKEIREHYVSALASDISAIPAVRVFMVERQRLIAAQQSCVLDGRDICLHVLPDAKYKFFLTADSAERARRRVAELRQKGAEADFQTVKKDIEQRDYNDSHRAVSPLIQAPDAVLVDTTCMTAEQAAEYIISHTEEAPCSIK